MNTIYKPSYHNINFKQYAKTPNPSSSRVWRLFVFYRLYIFLYNVDPSRFSSFEEIAKLHKESSFYANKKGHFLYALFLVSAPPTPDTMTATHAIQPIIIIIESAYNFKD